MTTANPATTFATPNLNTAKPQRLMSLDILRGLTIAFMILVNNNGNEAAAYWPLKHAAWNGFTPTDLVFPTFLFLVGITTVFSTAARLAQSASRESLFLHVLRRSIILYLLGIVVNSFPILSSSHHAILWSATPHCCLLSHRGLALSHQPWLARRGCFGFRCTCGILDPDALRSCSWIWAPRP